MRTSKKIAIAVISFLCIIILISVLMIEPMVQGGLYYYCDGHYREQTAGTYELLFMGDSDGLAAFSPAVYEKKTGIKSYNLSEEKNKFQSEYYMLKKEIERNPVKEVILQVGVETFVPGWYEDHAECDSVTLMRTTSLAERAKYLFQNVQFDKWMDVYSQMMMRGFLSLERNALGDKSSNFDASAKGWHKLEKINSTLSKEDAVRTFNTKSLETEYEHEKVDGFLRVISLCKEKNVSVCVVVIPMADWYIWEKDNIDEAMQPFYKLCEDNHIPFFDFNLYKNRYQLFNDNSSFKDSIHLSVEGAETFTSELANIYSDIISGKAHKELCFESYSRLKEKSPYYKYI